MDLVIQMEKKAAIRGLKSIIESLNDESATMSLINTCQKDATNLARDLFGIESDHYKTIRDANRFSMATQCGILFEEINSIIMELEERMVKKPGMELMVNNTISSCKDNVFIVHGRNDDVKEKIASFLKELDLEPIILHEQPNRSRTIIEKFEDHSSNVKYAVVLLTSDDRGGPIYEPNKQAPRARQNVVFEMGYFFGSLGRGRVCALLSPGVERPSDIDGIMYISLDQGNEWKGSLLRELKAAQLNLKDWIDPRIEEMAEALHKDAINLSLGRMEEIPWLDLDEKEKEQYRLQVKDLKERVKATADRT